MNLGHKTVDVEIVSVAPGAILINYEDEQITVPPEVCVGVDSLKPGDHELTVARWWWEDLVE